MLSQFWTSFYEQAAQIRIPTYDDYSTVNEQSSERKEPEMDIQSSSEATDSQTYEPSVAGTENSFMPGQAAFSSTPATGRGSRTFSSQHSDDPSWSASIESPLARIDRNLKSLSEDSGNVHATSMSIAGQPSLRLDDPTPVPGNPDRTLRLDKGKGKETPQPLLRNVLRQNMYSISDISLSGNTPSPVKPRGHVKSSVPKHFNPYLPPNTEPSTWSGVVDLRNTPLSTPQRRRHAKPTPVGDSDDDSFDGLPPGMSPPVLMSPARPPRSSAELGLLKLGKTPTREAAQRIKQDLISDFQRQSGEQVHSFYKYPVSRVESTMSSMSTPPSLSRYTRHGFDSGDSTTDRSSESAVRRAGYSDVPAPNSYLITTPGLRLRPKTFSAESRLISSSGSLPPEPHLEITDTLAPEPVTPILGEFNNDSDSDSEEEINNTAHPSAAFLMASQGSGSNLSDDEDSFDSARDDESFMDDGGLVPVHPFATGIDADETFDDSMYDEGVPEETVFGAPPVQRMHAQGSGHEAALRMLGESLDTIGIGQQLDGRGMETPTPANWGPRS